MIPSQLTQLRQVQTIGKEQMAKFKVAQVVAEMLAFNGPTLQDHVNRPWKGGVSRSGFKFDNFYILCAFVCAGEINKKDMQTFLRCWTTLKSQTALNRKIEDLFDVNDIPKTVATLHSLKKALQFQTLHVFYDKIETNVPEQFFNSPYHWVDDQSGKPSVWRLESKELKAEPDILFLNQVCGASVPMVAKKLTDFTFDTRKRFCIQEVNWKRYRDHTRHELAFIDTDIKNIGRKIEGNYFEVIPDLFCYRVVVYVDKSFPHAIEPVSACSALQTTTDMHLLYLQTRTCRMCDPHRPKLIERMAHAGDPDKKHLRCVTHEEYEDPSMLQAMRLLHAP